MSERDTAKKRKRRSSGLIDERRRKYGSSGGRQSRRRTARSRQRFLQFAAAAVIVAVLAIGVTVTYESIVTSYSSEAYEQASQQFDQGNYQEAVVALQQILESKQGDLTARILIGRAYLKLGYAADAEEALRRALLDGADRSLVSTPLALAYLSQGKFDALFEELPTNVQDAGLRAELLSAHGYAYLQLRQLGKAEQAFENAEQLRPRMLRAMLGRALVALRHGRYAQAEQSAEAAGTSAPDSAEVWYVKGEIRRAQRGLQDAVQAYDKAIELDPHHLESRLARADTLISLDRAQQAIDDLRAVWSARPNDPQANYLYALILAKVGDLEQAQEVIERAAMGLMSYRTEFVMRHPPSLLLMGVLHFRNQKYDQAFPFLDRYVQLEPNNTGARKLLGTILLMRDLPAGAVDVLTPALETTPADSELLALLGQAYTQDKKPETAARFLKRAMAIEPGRAELNAQFGLSQLARKSNSGSLDELDTRLDLGTSDKGVGILVGMLRLGRNNTEAALATARMLSGQQPDNAAITNMLGAVELLGGHLDEARQSFERALATDPAFAPAHRNLAAVERRQGSFEAARARLSALIARSPNDTRAMISLALMAHQQRRLPQAIEWLEKVRKSSPKALAPQLKLVEWYLQGAAIKQAQALVQALEERFPRNIPVRIARGRVELASGERDQASATFRALSQEAEGSAERRYRLVKYQLATNDIEGARESLRKVLEEDADFLQAHADLVALDLQEGKPNAALARARLLREQRPDSALGDQIHGDILVYQQHYQDAVTAYRTALGKEQSSALAVRLYNALNDNGETDRALGHLEAWITTRPADVAARRALANGYLDAERYSDARREYETLIEVHPDDPSALSHLARLYLRDGDPRAAKYAREAYRRDPKGADALDALGWLLVSEGDPGSGLRYLREAHSRASKALRIRYHIGAALNRLGRDSEARRELRRILAEQRSFEGITRARKLLSELNSG